MTRGYCGIGIYRGKFSENLGTLWRSAFCLGASFTFTIGARHTRQPSDATEAYRYLPHFSYEDLSDFYAHLPKDSALVGVELYARAEPLESFAHPERAIYLLGPEDGSIPPEVIFQCDSVVQFTSRYCLNVASAGTVVLYDRQAKLGRSLPAQDVEVPSEVCV